MRNGWMIKALFPPLWMHFLSFSKKAKILKRPSIRHQRKDKNYKSRQALMKSGNNLEWEWWSTDTGQWLISSRRLILYNWTIVRKCLENLKTLAWILKNLASLNKIWRTRLFWSIFVKRTQIKLTVLTQLKIWKITWERYTQVKSVTNTCT